MFRIVSLFHLYPTLITCLPKNHLNTASCILFSFPCRHFLRGCRTNILYALVMYFNTRYLSSTLKPPRFLLVDLYNSISSFYVITKTAQSLHPHEVQIFSWALCFQIFVIYSYCGLMCSNSM